MKLEINQELLEFFIKLNLLISEFSFETDEIIDALVLAQRNVLHPVILNNIELKEHLITIKQTMTQTQSLPVDIFETGAINEFLKLIKISTKFSNSQLIYSLKFPLCNQDDYILYRLWPMPIEIAHAQFIFIQPHNPYMAISNDKQKFIGLSDWDMLNTISLTYTKYYLLNSAVFLKTFPLCEIQLFDSQKLIKLPEYCIVQHVYYDNINFEKMQSKNKYLYWIANATHTTLVCPTSTVVHILQGVGIITIPHDCVLYTTAAILSPTNEINHIIFTDFYPELNLISLQEISEKINKLTASKQSLKLSELKTPNLRNLHETTRNLDSLLIDIEKQSSDDFFTTNTIIHQYGLYIISVIVGSILIHIIFKLRKTRHTASNNPNSRINQRIRHTGRMI